MARALSNKTAFEFRPADFVALGDRQLRMSASKLSATAENIARFVGWPSLAVSLAESAEAMRRELSNRKTKGTS